MMKAINIRRFATILLLSLTALPICAQNNKTQETKYKIFEEPEVFPQFPGGDQALIEFIENNLHCPKKVLRTGTYGRIVVSFIVEKDGTVCETKIVGNLLKNKTGEPCNDTKLKKKCEKEALRIMKMMPRWIPGTRNGVRIRMKYHIPFRFNMTKPLDKNTK